MTWKSSLLRKFSAALIAATPVIAFAADDDEKLPPFDVAGLPHTRIWVPWLAAFLIMAVCLLVALKNPRRSHLD